MTIDAPERGQAYGTKSKEHLSDAVAGNFIVVDHEKRDRYGRIVGKVLLGSEDVNLEQVRAGMAWHYKKYQGEQSISDRVVYSDAEMDGRRHERGLWGGPAPVPPWDYRKAEPDRKKAMIPFTVKSQARYKLY